MKRNKPTYRDLKKLLNPYHKFSFPTPRKGKDFTPQQKSAITRLYRKLQGVLENIDNVTFIRYKKGKGNYRGVDGLRTSKGIFIAEKDVKIKYNKKLKKYSSTYKVKKYFFSDFTFPPDIYNNTDFIEMWVDYLIQRYKDTENVYEDFKIRGYALYEIMWLRHGTREGNRYDPTLFYKYFDPNDEPIDFNKEADENNTKIGSIIGVTLVFFKWVKRKRKS